MLRILECVLTIGAIAVVRMFVGRLAATAVAITAVPLAVLMAPPFLSLRVEEGADFAMLLLQSVFGFVVASKPKNRREALESRVSYAPRPTPIQSQCSLASGARIVMERDAQLRPRLKDLQVYGASEVHVGLSDPDLERILSDILRMAFSHPDVRCVGAYAARQPSLDRITIAAEYDLTSALPRIRTVGRSDSVPLETGNWPPNCSASWFDNGFEYIYQIAIQKSA